MMQTCQISQPITGTCVVLDSITVHMSYLSKESAHCMVSYLAAINLQKS